MCVISALAFAFFGFPKEARKSTSLLLRTSPSAFECPGSAGTSFLSPSTSNGLTAYPPLGIWTSSIRCFEAHQAHTQVSGSFHNMTRTSSDPLGGLDRTQVTASLPSHNGDLALSHVGNSSARQQTDHSPRPSISAPEAAQLALYPSNNASSVHHTQFVRPHPNAC